MHQVILLLALVLLFAHPAAGRQSSRALSSADLVRGVTTVRLSFLQDSTPVDFCALPELFGADGVLPREPKQPPARYATSRDCSSAGRESRSLPRVEVLRRTVVGDTVVVHGITDRGWIAFSEEYHFIPPFDGGRSVPQYRIGAFVRR